MYFVHPQIKLTQKNLKEISLCFFKFPQSEALKKKFSFYFPDKQIVFTDMGRSAFRIMIEKMNLRNSEILFPAYICDIFLPILKKYNLKPIFLDVDPKTFNIQTKDIEKKITPQTKAIFISHIYGLPNNINPILKIAKKHKLKVMEDCAHCLGIKMNHKYLGNFGEAAMFSFYKSLPVIRGGMLICPKDWQIDLDKTDFSLRDFLSFLNCFPCWAYIFKKLGNQVAPKIIRKEKLIKIGAINKVSLNLINYFLNYHQQKSKKRIKLALSYQQELKKLGFQIPKSKNNSFCYLSVLMPEKIKNKRDALVKELQKRNVFCTRMWHQPLASHYDIKKYPFTLDISQRIINFPLQDFFEKKEVKKIVSETQKCLDIIE